MLEIDVRLMKANFDEVVERNGCLRSFALGGPPAPLSSKYVFSPIDLSD